MKAFVPIAWLAAGLLAGTTCVSAKDFKIGDRVECDAAIGTIVRTEERPAWGVPFFIVKIEGAGAGYEYKCLPDRMRAVAAAADVSSTPRAGSQSDDPVAPNPTQPRSDADAIRGSEPIADSANEATTVTTAPDGSYRCHKISPGGQLMDIGDLEIDDGEAEMAGMPEGWHVLSVAPGTDDRGQPLVILHYRSAAGFNDRLDCLER